MKLFKRKFNREISLLVDRIDHQHTCIQRFQVEFNAIQHLEAWMNPVRVWNGIRANRADGETHYEQHWFCRIDGWPFGCTGRGNTIAEAVKDCESKIEEAKCKAGGKNGIKIM